MTTIQTLMKTRSVSFVLGALLTAIIGVITASTNVPVVIQEAVSLYCTSSEDMREVMRARINTGMPHSIEVTCEGDLE